MAVQLLPLLTRVLGSQFGKDAMLYAAASVSGKMMREDKEKEPDAPPVAGAPQPPPTPQGWNAPGGNRTGAPPVSNPPPAKAQASGNDGGGPPRFDAQTMTGIVNGIIGAGLLKPPGIPQGNPVRDSLYSIAKPQQVQVAEDAKQTSKETLKSIVGMNVGTPKHRVESWLKLQTIVGTMPARIEKWGDALHESQRKLMQFNGTIARSFIEREQRDISRSIQSGRRTAGSTRSMGEAVDGLKDSLQPYRDLLTNLTNTFGGTLARLADMGIQYGPLMSPILGYLKVIAEVLQKIYDIENENQQSDPFFLQLSKELTQGVNDPNSPVSRRRVKP